MRKLEIDSLKSDLHAVRKLLQRRTPENDPIGHAQFSSRILELEEAIQELEGTPETRASLAVFFSGQPVQGSRGVDASFASKAVGLFQDLIAKQFASMETGLMAKVGPIPLRGNSDMLLTDVARGSVGFILEEAERNNSFMESELSVAVQRVAMDIRQTTSPDPAAFEVFLADVDYRYFSSLGSLFKLFDDSRATVRLVENDQDFALDAAAVQLGRERTDATIANDNDNLRLAGRLWVLPGEHRFELVVDGEADRISGTISKELTLEELERLGNGEHWVVRLRERTIVRPNRAPQSRHTLIALIARTSP